MDKADQAVGHLLKGELRHRHAVLFKLAMADITHLNHQRAVRVICVRQRKIAAGQNTGPPFGHSKSWCAKHRHRINIYSNRNAFQYLQHLIGSGINPTRTRNIGKAKIRNARRRFHIQGHLIAKVYDIDLSKYSRNPVKADAALAIRRYGELQRSRVIHCDLYNPGHIVKTIHLDRNIPRDI